jgi:hypothetical protein
MDFLHIATGVSNMGQALQTGACLGVIDCCMYELKLVYISIYMYIRACTSYISIYNEQRTSGAM